jgi:hypothetical protein
MSLLITKTAASSGAETGEEEEGREGRMEVAGGALSVKE